MNYTNLHHVLVVEHDDHTSFFTLNNESFTVGRHSSNALVLKAKVISRYHATILPIKSNKGDEVTSFWIIDGTEQGVVSTNGFTVNNESCLMHQLKPGDRVDFPDGTKITYQVKDKSEEEEEDNSDDLLPTRRIVVPTQEKLDNQFKIRTDFHDFLPASRLDTRIYVQNMSMLCLLLEKELEVMRGKSDILSLIFIYYNSKNMKEISPKSYQKILRLYQLVVNQKITNPSDFILSFNDLEIAVIHNCNQTAVTELAESLATDIYTTSEKINLPDAENILSCAYIQIPKNELNVKFLIEKVKHILVAKDDNNLFVNLNLIKI